MIGTHLYDLDTPTLWVDLDVLEKNISYFSNFFNQANVSWRPHIKGIKVPAVAHKMIDSGAIGITCAKLSEAEVMIATGIRDILISNQIAGPLKVEKLAALQRHADLKVAIDSFANAKEVSRAAVKYGVNVGVLIEVNTGLNRSGVEPGEPVLELAEQVALLPGVKLKGVMSWEGGHVIKIKDPVQKEAHCRETVSLMVASAELLKVHGFEVSIVSCGGSGTYKISSYVKGVTEIQAGGAVFGSVIYREWGVDLEYALFVLASVISCPTPNRVIVDAGRKSLNCELALPLVKDFSGVVVSALHSEHGILDQKLSDQPLRYGDKVNFIVGYGDYTVNLYDQLVAVRNSRVELVWDILARGKIQ